MPFKMHDKGESVKVTKALRVKMHEREKKVDEKGKELEKEGAKLPIFRKN